MKLRHLSLRINGRRLVDALDWRIEPGQCWCIIGRNGAGKSTLLRAMAGLRPPDGGDIEIAGRPLTAWPLTDLARQRAYLAQSRADAFGYRVIESVLTSRHPYDESGYWESSDDYRAAHDALSRLDVLHLAERDIRTLSGGERQRVAIAAVLAQDTPLLLLDEPANALDLAHQMSLMKLLGRACRQAGKAVVMVSHDLNLAHGVATHALLLMDDGAWHAGPVGEVMQPALLGRCLGYPIDAVRHGERLIYLPSEELSP